MKNKIASNKAKTNVFEPAQAGSDSVEKMVIKPTVKQRNLVARAAMTKTGAGAHEKNATAKRKALDKEMRKQLDE